MKPKSRNFAQLLVVAGATVSVVVAPVAAAAPTAWVSVECDEAGD